MRVGTDEDLSPGDGRPPDPRPGRGRRPALALVVTGLAAMVAAGTGLATGGSPPRPPPGLGRPAPPTTGPRALVISGPADVAVDRLTYRPGQSSSWHMHSGLHAVEVLAGTLTVYDRDCQPHAFRAGESYVGGTDEHMARNETDDVVDMVVTYIFSAGTSMADFVIPMPTPTGCGAASPRPEPTPDAGRASGPTDRQRSAAPGEAP